MKKLPQRQQLASCRRQCTQPLVNFLNNTCLRSDFSAQPLSKLNNFSLCKKRCTTIINPYSLLMILQSLQFVLICGPEDNLISNCGPNIKMTLSFDDVVQFIDDENMVTYVDFDCGFTFFPETPTKNRQINRERNYNFTSLEKPQCSPSNDQHTCFVDEQQSSNIFLKPYNLWDMVAAALMSLSHTNDTYSTFNQYPQPTTQQHRTDSYPVFPSLRTMNFKRKGLRVSFALFQRNYLPDGRMNETVAKVEKLSDIWKPGAMDGTPPFLMNCSCI